MRHIAVLLLSAQAFAQNDISTHFTFASADGGNKTLVSWTFGGAYVSEQGIIWSNGSMSTTGWGLGWPLPIANPMFVNAIDRDISLSVANSVFAVTNLTTSQVSTGSVLHIETQTGQYQFEQFYISVSLSVQNGDALRVTPGSGSAVVDIAFSEFNLGAYQPVGNSGPGVTYPFTGSGTVLGAIPEASTYGIAFGALALAGALVRRRAKRV